MTDASPLEGVRVLEFAQLFPGPYAGLVLAELGADVVKVEPPTGDPTRGVPPFVDRAGGAGAIFCALNRSKQSVTLDLKADEGLEAFHELAQGCDVVLDGYRPGVAERLGVGYEELARGRENLVYARISGFGPDGEKAGDPGHDVTYQAWAGTIDSQDPRLPNLPAADASSALWAAVLVLAHLHEPGTHRLEPSLAGSLQAPAILQDAITAAGSDARPLTGDHPGYQIYECRNGQALAVGALEPHFWEALCEALELEEVQPLGDPRSPSDPEQARNRLANRFAEETREAWTDRLEAAGVPCAPVRSRQEALEAPLASTSIDPPGVDGPEDLAGAPELGEHNDALLGD